MTSPQLASRQRSVLFSLGRTWEWDGANWTDRTPAVTPSLGSWPVMAYDPARRRVVLFGGSSAVAFETETWEWDGTTWSNRTPAIVPRARYGVTMAWDGQSQRIVLFSGSRNLGATEYFDELWQWDGTAWTQVQRAAQWPTSRNGAVGVWDSTRMRVVMFGGTDATSIFLSETWEWDGSEWHAAAVVAAPGQRVASAVVWDAARARMVLFGGANQQGRLADTWEWDGLSWTRAQPPASPRARMVPALGFDRLRQRVVLFGGQDGMNLFDTWQFDGSTWTALSPMNAPEGNGLGSFSWDPVNQRLLLVRGQNAGGVIELWSFDGAEWTNTFTPWPGMNCLSSSSAFDVGRSRLVLFCNSSAQTWEYDGTSWTQRAPARSPTPRGITSMTWNSGTQRVTLFGGTATSSSGPGETWEYDGTQWTQLPAGASPTGNVSRSALVYDEARQRLTLFDGVGTYIYLP